MHWQTLWGPEPVEGRRYEESMCLWSTDKPISREQPGRLGGGERAAFYQIHFAWCFILCKHAVYVIENTGSKAVVPG